MNHRYRITAVQGLLLLCAAHWGTGASAAEANAEALARLHTLAAEVLPATGLQKLSTQEWFASSQPGCRFRLADPPSSFTQFFVSTHAEGLSELDCGGLRTIGMFKKGALVGPAAVLAASDGVAVAGAHWPAGVLNGPGASLHPDGTRYQGSLTAGKFNGAILIVHPGGQTSKGSMANDRLAPGELSRYDTDGKLLRKTTIGRDSRATAVKEYAGDVLLLESPLVDDLKQGFGYAYPAGAHNESQRRVTLWDKGKVKYQSPPLAEIMNSPCPPLLSALGGFRPTPESCSEAVMAAARAAAAHAEAVATATAAAQAALLAPPVAAVEVPAPAVAVAPTVKTAKAPPGKAPVTAAIAVVVPDVAATPPLPPPPVMPPPLLVQEFPFLAYSEDGRHYVRGITRNGELIPDEIGFDGGARRYKSKSMDSKLNGRARYFQNEELIWDGDLLDAQFDGEGLCRFNGSLERCEYAYGERVDQLYKTRLELQAYKSAKQQEQEQIARAHQQALAAERQRIAAAQAAQAAQPESGGFQWGKFAALGTGALLGGLTELPSDMQAKIVTGLVTDSMAGQEGISATQAAVQPSNAGGAPSAVGVASAAPPKPPRQATNFQATCPSGTQINIPISYRSQACLVAAQDFALAYSCNDADRFASVTQGCVSACGSPQCAEP